MIPPLESRVEFINYEYFIAVKPSQGLTGVSRSGGLPQPRLI